MTYQKIFKAVKKAGYFNKHERVLVAVSSGVDSMNLLLFLHRYQQELGLKLAIAHVNHKQRPQSDQEESYLRAWSASHELPFYVSSFSGTFSEKAARDFRYHFFKKVMEDQAYTALVTAHHADDQAETIFMRILRGSRLRHLAAMKQVQPFGPGELIRPFLGLAKADLPEVFHFEDASNHGDDYLRNRIRHTYLPSLKAENPAFKEHLLDLGQEADLLVEALTDLLGTYELTDLLAFRKQSPAVQHFWLQAYLETFSDLRLKKGQFEQLLRQVQQARPKTLKVKAGYYLHIRAKRFYLDKIGPQTDGQVELEVLEYGNIVSIGQTDFEFGQAGSIALTSRSPIYLRPRRPGDQLDFGVFHKKLRRLFIDEKIPQEERQKAIVAEQDGQILLVLVGGGLYLRKQPQCVTIKAKLRIKTKETDDYDSGQ